MSRFFRQSFVRPAILTAIVMVLITFSLWVSGSVATTRTVQSERENLSDLAALAAASYQGKIDKFGLVATTLAAAPDVEQALIGGEQAQFMVLNERLAELTKELDASVIYIMDKDGHTVSSSNWREPDSFVGESYNFRRYFTNGLRDGASEQYAKGTRSMIPGLFLARRVGSNERPLGVVVVKIRFDSIEQDWANTIGDVFVTNSDGVVLITSRPKLRFHTLTKLDAAAVQSMRASQDFGDAALIQLPAYASGTVAAAQSYRGEALIEAKIPLSGDRELRIVSPIRSAVIAARNFAWLVVAFIFVLIVVLILTYSVRRRSLLQKREREHQNRVDDLKLRLEQANRLSFLGQIAAGVGHELNQPLGAIGMRADATRKFVERGDLDKAEQSLGEIEQLVLRAGKITEELRDFARRSPGQKSTTTLSKVLEGVHLLIGDRLRKKDARLIVNLDQDLVAIECEQGRLEQVFVNLIQNALDAGEQNPEGQATEVRISSQTQAETVKVLVRDNGPGIPETARAMLFQPFNTSKDQGLGLGLVICRDIMADFGGEITYCEDEGGACFELCLRRSL